MKNMAFTKYHFPLLMFSFVIILTALVMNLFGAGLNLGIDFTGGSLLEYAVGEDFSTEEVSEILARSGYRDSRVSKAADAGGTGEMTNLQIRLMLDDGETDQTMQVREILEKEMGGRYKGFRYISIEHTGAVSSAGLVENAVKALSLALLLMLIYIIFRFDLYSGLTALLGLAHDVMIMLSFMTFFRSAYQVNSSFIAALLTIVGYSINNTIIVFDRVRENRKNNTEGLTNLEIAEKSERESFSRTVNTTLTTLFTLAALYILGVDSIREFTFPLVVGMLAGAYSSLLLNGPIWARLADRAEKRKAGQAHS